MGRRNRRSRNQTTSSARQYKAPPNAKRGSSARSRNGIAVSQKAIGEGQLRVDQGGPRRGRPSDGHGEGGSGAPEGRRERQCVGRSRTTKTNRRGLGRVSRLREGD